MGKETSSVNTFTNRVFFTERDDSITGTSQRDPLGFQPIWSYYGRQVINHLTTITTSIHGFREVLLCLSICNEIADKKINSILLFEQLFIYSAISNGRAKGILGAERGGKRFKNANENPEVRASDADTILVREISTGYYGRYKTPLVTMGIINERSELEIEHNEIKKLYGEDRYSKILEAFRQVVSGKSFKFKSFKKSGELFEAVFGKFRAGECDFWIDRLNKVGDKENGLMKRCYEKVNSKSAAKDLFRFLPQDDNKVLNILKLEPYLRCLEEVFYKAMNSKDIASIEEIDISEHKKRFEKFCSISIDDESPLFKERMEFLKNNCSPDSRNYFKSVIEYHGLVCKQKGSSVWIDLDSAGRLQAFVDTTDVIIDISEWGRDYYFNSLKSIKSEILEFQNE